MKKPGKTALWLVCVIATLGCRLTPGPLPDAGRDFAVLTVQFES